MGSATTAALFLGEYINTEEALFSILLTFSSHLITEWAWVCFPIEDPRLAYVYISPDAYMRCNIDDYGANNKIFGQASEERQCLMPSCARCDSFRLHSVL